MPSTPSRATTPTSTTDTRAMGVKRMLQKARLASQVSGEVRTPK